MAKQRILFLYLMAGNGHYMSAKTLYDEIKGRYDGDVEVIIENGLSPKQKFSHLIFEGGYHILANYLYFFWKFICFANKSIFIRNFLRLFIERPTTRYITELIRRHNITHVVCTNYVFCSNAHNAIVKGNFKIPLTIIVTDPFDAHAAWFDVKDAHYILFSKESRELALKKYHIKDSVVFPYIIQQKFKFAERVRKESSPFTVLIAGGGEGLPNMVALVYYILYSLTKNAKAGTKEGPKDGAKEGPKDGAKEGPKIKLVVVCGRDKSAYEILKRYTLVYRHIKADIYGYVNNMNELLQAANCVITKAGPATIMESLVCGTPLIISTYLPQEKPNIRYIEDNNVGWCIKNPKKIFNKVCTLAQDKTLYGNIQDNIAKLNIKVDNSALAKHLCEYGKR